ncbi:MAG: hypothetical protein JW889_05950 [Verrucomicrobia bacterium]|nr:hypothetical protein [Verrucomicrobiota bacterium]
MKVVGLEGLSDEQVRQELERGARFVLFQYCISLFVVTFKRSSGIYFVRAGEGVASRAFGYSLISLLLGWWGIPWGPIWTIATLVTNAGGGKDVTADLLAAMAQQAAPPTAPVVAGGQPPHV